MALLGSMCQRNTRSFIRLFNPSFSNKYSTVTKRLFCTIDNSQCLSRPLICLKASQGTIPRTVSVRLGTSHRSKCLVRSAPALFSLHNVHYFSSGKSEGIPNLTSDILQSKIGEAQKETTDDGSRKQQEESKNDSKDKGGKSKENWFHAKHAWKLGLLSLTAMSALMCGNLIVLWGKPLLDAEGNELEDEFTSLPVWEAYTRRAYREAHFFKKMIEEPSYKKLLPDPLKEPWYQPPYTLVIELNGVLVHPDWTLGTGWRFKKRPAVTYFLQQVASPMFEVVIFTKEQGFTAFPIVDGLDPNGHVTFRLFRDATRYMNGTHVKDLDNLNRDLSKVILVDCDPKAFQKHPQNALLLKKWTGEDADRALLDLANFLKTIAVSNVDDVRPVLEYYSQYDDPLQAFKENQRRLQDEQDKVAKTPEQQDKQSLTGFGRSLLRRR